MAIYYFYLFYCATLSLTLRSFLKKHRRKISTYFLGFGLFLMMGLRGETVGNDLLRYIDFYQGIGMLSKSQTSTEIGYFFFLKSLNFLGIGKQGFIIVTSLICSASFSWFFYKYSKNIAFSFFLHVTIGLFAFTMTGIRQSLAICLILLAIHFMINRKLLSFLISVFFAGTFHFTAVVFFPIYFVPNLIGKSYKSITFLFFLLLITSAIFNNYIFSWVLYFSPDRYIVEYVQSSYHGELGILSIAVPIAIPISVILMWLIQRSKAYELDRAGTIFFILSCVTGFIMVLSLNLALLDRISYYFVTANMVLVPNVLSKFDRTFNKYFVVSIIVLLCLIYFTLVTNGGILEVDTYNFFWN